MSEQSSPNSSDSDDSSDPEAGLEDKVYSDVLTKLRSLQDGSEKGEYSRTVLSDGAKSMRELIELIEKHKDNTMSQATVLSISNGFKAFTHLLNNIGMDELFKKDSSAAYEIFYSYINLFNLTGMKNYLKRLYMQVYVKILYKQFASVILQVIELASIYYKFTIADIKEPLDNQELLLLMLKFMKADLEPDSASTYSSITHSILSFLWNYSDKTVVVPNLIKTGYPEAVLKWLSVSNRQDDVSLPSDLVKSKEDVARPLINIIHNISRHDDGINVLNSLGATSIVQEVRNETKDSEINILCCMILALLSTPEQIKNDRKHMNNTLDQLLQSVSNASKSKDYKDDGFHISEPLVVLVKLFNDDRALNYILQHAQVKLDASSTVEFFVNLLLNFHDTVSSEKDPLKQLTCIALVNILWSISFQEHYQYKRQLNHNQDLMTLLEKFCNSDETNETASHSIQYVPKYIESIQTAANGILLNISKKKSEVNMESRLPVPAVLRSPKRGSLVEALVPQPMQIEYSKLDNNNSCSNKPMIMISYSHEDKVLCYQLEEELKRNDQFDLWIDKNYCATGDSWEHIARGMKQSQVILCLITKNYTSKSVRREVIYAIDRLDKPLVPLLVLKPDLPEWLDIRTCDLTHVRFNDEKQVDRSKMSQLIETLQKLIPGSNNNSGSAPVHHEPPITIVQTSNEKTDDDRDKLATNKSFSNATATTTNLSQKPIDQWNTSDIKQWFQENGIILELFSMCQFSDGSELLNYAKLLLEDEKAQCKSYSEEFPKLYNGRTLLLHQFNKFSNALQKLINQQNKRTLPVKPTSTTTGTKSPTCQIL